MPHNYLQFVATDPVRGAVGVAIAIIGMIIIPAGGH